MYEITCNECKKKIMLCDEMICRECYNKIAVANDDLNMENTALSNTLKSKESKKVKQIKNLMDLYERGVITYWIYMEEIKKIVSTV